MTGEQRALPARLTIREVLDLARYSRPTLFRRIEAGRMPAAVDRNAHGLIFDRDAVFKALGLSPYDPPSTADDWSIDADAFHQARSRQVRDPAAPRRRHHARPVSGAPKAATLRLVADDSAAPHR